MSITPTRAKASASEGLVAEEKHADVPVADKIALYISPFLIASSNAFYADPTAGTLGLWISIGPPIVCVATTAYDLLRDKSRDDNLGRTTTALLSDGFTSFWEGIHHFKNVQAVTMRRAGLRFVGEGSMSAIKKITAYKGLALVNIVIGSCIIYERHPHFAWGAAAFFVSVPGHLIKGLQKNAHTDQNIPLRWNPWLFYLSSIAATICSIPLSDHMQKMAAASLLGGMAALLMRSNIIPGVRSNGWLRHFTEAKSVACGLLTIGITQIVNAVKTKQSLDFGLSLTCAGAGLLMSETRELVEFVQAAKLMTSRSIARVKKKLVAPSVTLSL